MARALVTENWPDIQRAAEQGMSFKELSELYGVSYETIKKKAQRERWLTVPLMKAKMAELSRKAPNPAGQGGESLEKTDGTKDIGTILIENWAEKGTQIRSLAWDIANKSLAPLAKTGIPVKDAGDVAKLVKVAREATGLFQDQAAVQVSVFSGQTGGFDGKTVETDVEIMEVETDSGEEM